MFIKVQLNLSAKQEARISGIKARTALAGQAVVGRLKELKSKIPTVTITINKGE